MGSELIARVPSETMPPHARDRERPAGVEAVHRAYQTAGAQWLATNTFLVAGSSDAIAETRAAVRLAREASGGLPVALSLGPGPAPGAYAEAARAAANAGADLVLLENFTSARAAAEAARAVVGGGGIPVVVLLVFDDNGLTLAGREPAEAGVSLLVEAGVGGVGTNCQPPDVLEKVVPRIAAAGAPLPVLVRPSAGIPARCGESWVYPWAPEPWAAATAALRSSGATLLGGCCGAGPTHITALARLLAAARGT